jgi:AcrR family transcriptional regulator
MSTSKKLSASALKILACATDLLAEKGFDGAIMDTLAERCGVNKASIYYHFQDKQHLYEVVLTRLFSNVVNQVIHNISAEQHATEQLKAFVDSFAQAASLEPKMPSLLMREIAVGGRDMPVSARQEMQRLLQKLTAIIELGVQEGIFRSTDPLTLQFMIVGSLCFHITSAPMRQAIPSDNPIDPSLSEMVTHITSLLEQALKI